MSLWQRLNFGKHKLKRNHQLCIPPKRNPRKNESRDILRTKINFYSNTMSLILEFTVLYQFLKIGTSDGNIIGRDQLIEFIGFS